MRPFVTHTWLLCVATSQSDRMQDWLPCYLLVCFALPTVSQKYLVQRHWPVLIWATSIFTRYTTLLLSLDKSFRWFVVAQEYNGSNIKFTLERATKARRGSSCIALLFLNLGARWGWVVNATPRPLYPRERPGTHCIGGWVGPRARLDGYGKSRLHRDSTPGPFSL